MTEHDPAGGRAPSGGEGGILSLAELLNILYRQRWLILALTGLGLALGVAYGFIATPRYNAHAQVRPGVVAYASDGSPLREWALEDVVRWFEDGHYWSLLRTEEAFADGPVPEITAEFIPSLNFVAGGNVITLETFAPDPQLAAMTLDHAILAFNRLATRDTLGSTVFLTRRELSLDIERVRRQVEQLEAEKERTSLAIEQRERDLDLLGLERRNVELDLADLEAQNAWRRETAKVLRDEAETTRTRLASAEELLGRVMSGEEAAAAPPRDAGDPLTEVLLQTAGREQAGRVGELLETVAGLGRAAVNATVRADSLETMIKTSELEMQRLRGVLDIELAKKEADVRQAIRDLQIKLERDLPHDKATFENEIQTYRVKRDVVSPLERVGDIGASDKPVRPRKLRAALILTILAGAGALVLALLREYYLRNRDVITAPRRPA